MSITIYNGMRYKGTILNLKKELDVVRERIVAANDKFFSDLMKRHIVTIYDLSAYLTKEELLKMFPQINENRALYFYARDRAKMVFEEDFGDTVMMVYPLSSKEILLYPFLPNPYMKIAQNHEAFEQYGYWDNVDREEGVSTAEWGRREKKWGKVFEKTNVLREAGFEYIFINDTPLIMPDKLDKDGVDDDENRIRRVLLHLKEVKKYAKGINKDGSSIELKPLQPIPSDLSRWMMDKLWEQPEQDSGQAQSTETLS